MRGKLENFSVKSLGKEWYVSDSETLYKDGRGAYVHSDLEVYPGMGSHWSGGDKGGFEYLPTREEAEKRLEDFLNYHNFKVFHFVNNQWYVGNEMQTLGLDRYVHADLEVHPSMRDAKGKLQYLSTREEAEERLRLFNLKRNVQKDETDNQKEPGFVPELGSTNAALNVTGWEDVKNDYLPDPETEEGCGEPTRVEEVRQNRHTQLLLEDESEPTVTSIRGRLVTDGERLVLEVKTPTFPFYQAVARLQVNKKGQVVMYRERGTEDRFIKTDSEGRINN